MLITHAVAENNQIVEEVVLQVRTKELKTLGGHTSGCMLLDSGCSRTVAGIDWMEDYRQGMNEGDLKQIVKIIDTQNVAFRFGVGLTFKSMGLFKILAEIDGKRVFIKCHIV